MTADCTAKDAVSVVVTQEPPGAHCAAGGARVQVGTDAPTCVCTSATVVNHSAWYSELGTSEHCGPTGTPLPEDFGTNGPYATAGTSAWVLDWCFAGEGSINSCSRSTAPSSRR